MSAPTVEQLVAEFTQLYPPPPPAPVVEAPAPVAPPPAPAATAEGAAPAPAPKPAAAKAPAGPTLQTERAHGPQAVDFASRGFHLDLAIPAADVVAVATRLLQLEFSLDTMTGVDWQKLGQMEVVYDYLHFAKGLRLVVRCRVPREKPELPSIAHLFQGANWHERETHDFFGIRFLGHPNLIPFLLPEDTTYHPLRKDFAGAAD
jgi:NADH-quinone oxidoreductase subunit C